MLFLIFFFATSSAQERPLTQIGIRVHDGVVNQIIPGRSAEASIVECGHLDRCIVVEPSSIRGFGPLTRENWSVWYDRHLKKSRLVLEGTSPISYRVEGANSDKSHHAHSQDSTTHFDEHAMAILNLDCHLMPALQSWIRGFDDDTDNPTTAALRSTLNVKNQHCSDIEYRYSMVVLLKSWAHSIDITRLTPYGVGEVESRAVHHLIEYVLTAYPEHGFIKLSGYFVRGCAVPPAESTDWFRLLSPIEWDRHEAADTVPCNVGYNAANAAGSGGATGATGPGSVLPLPAGLTIDEQVARLYRLLGTQ